MAPVIAVAAGAGVIGIALRALPDESLPPLSDDALGSRLLSAGERSDLEHMLSFAHATYEKPPVRANVKWEEVASNADRNVRAIGRVVAHGEVELGFRGSVFTDNDGARQLANWTHLNANLRPVAIDADVRPLGSAAPAGTRVHDGFLTAWLRVRDGCCEWLQSNSVGVGALVKVCGHSLGGAIATLCALDLSLQGYAVQLVTWGAPRVGNVTFAAFFRKHVHLTDVARFVTGGDPIPRLPLHRSPLHPLTNFSHVCAASRIDVVASEEEEKEMLHDAMSQAEAEAVLGVNQVEAQGGVSEPAAASDLQSRAGAVRSAAGRAVNLLGAAQKKLANIGSGVGQAAALPKQAVQAHLLLTGYERGLCARKASS